MLLETVSGKLVDVTNPQSHQISIDDIAWGISRISRFCGATITEIPYNVAQHSIFVAEEVQAILHDAQNNSLNGYPELKQTTELDLVMKLSWSNDTAIFGLIHDAAEAYTGDVPSPIKKLPELQPVFKSIEQKLMLAVYEHLGMTKPTALQEIIIKHADKIAQRIESHAFMSSRGKDWIGLPQVSLKKLQQFKDPIPSLLAYEMFMSKFNELRR
jgi:hypothetical protein